jgi:hypothetical protein
VLCAIDYLRSILNLDCVRYGFGLFGFGYGLVTNASTGQAQDCVKFKKIDGRCSTDTEPLDLKVRY